jgi:hypothetical protein
LKENLFGDAFSEKTAFKANAFCGFPLQNEFLVACLKNFQNRLQQSLHFMFWN